MNLKYGSILNIEKWNNYFIELRSSKIFKIFKQKKNKNFTWQCFK